MTKVNVQISESKDYENTFKRGDYFLLSDTNDIYVLSSWSNYNKFHTYALVNINTGTTWNGGKDSISEAMQIDDENEEGTFQHVKKISVVAEM